MRIFSTLQDKVSSLRSDRRGAIAAIAGITLLGSMGLTAVVVDVGSALVVRTTMQAAADAAALSGAGVLAAQGPSTAISTASNYGAQSGGRNVTSSVTVTNASGYPTTRCLTSIGVSCTGTPTANAVVVRQQAAVPTYFTRLFGFDHIDVNVMSTAAVAGGVTKPVNVMMVLDTTGSMNTNSSNCGGITKMRCATNGVVSLLTGMAPSASKVALMTFPPTTTSTQAARAYDCNTSTNPAVAPYNATTKTYNILPFGNDFRASDTSPVVGANNLAAGSNMVRAVGGSSNCSGRMGATGGVGTYYAEALRQAQTQLAALPVNATNPATNVIIILSDGDATADSDNISSAQLANQCKQAVDAAASAKAAGTKIYAVAYDAPISGGCARDSVALSPCNAMKAIASDASSFYSSASSGARNCTGVNSTSGLNAIFQAIGQNFRGTRLVPNSTI